MSDTLTPETDSVSTKVLVGKLRISFEVVPVGFARTLERERDYFSGCVTRLKRELADDQRERDQWRELATNLAENGGGETRKMPYRYSAKAYEEALNAYEQLKEGAK